MTKLAQIVAISKDEKGKATRVFTDLHRAVQKAELLQGIARTYTPNDDEGEQLPSESKGVQVKVDEVLAEARQALTRLFDITLTQDVTNTVAKADVVVDGKVIVKDAPVSYLLFLEKQLVDLHTFFAKLPVLDPADQWTQDNTTNAYRSQVTQTTRSKKTPRNWVKYEATTEHPAQVEMYYEDNIVGTWNTTKFSGAVPAARVAELVERVDALRKAVKFAREEANGTTVVDRQAGKAIFDYLLA